MPSRLDFLLERRKMDALDLLLQLTPLCGSLDARCQLSGAWLLDHPQAPAGEATYHAVLHGECWVELPGQIPISIGPGQIVLLPRGAAHLLRSKGVSRPSSEPSERHNGVLNLYCNTSAAEELDVLCGHFNYAPGATLLGTLPEPLLVSLYGPGETAQLTLLIELLRGEANARRPGATAVVNALATALFALILRAYLQQQPLTAGVLQLSSDKRLAPVLLAMMRAPAHSWSLDELASLASMSRATFVRSFARLAGLAPMVLLTRFRMQLAGTLLRTTCQRISDIAAAAGYQSEAAFSRSFRAAYGLSPGRYRKTEQAPIDPAFK